MIKDFITYINEGLFDRNQSEFNIRKTDKGIEQVYIPKTKEELYEYIELDIKQAKKDGTYPDVNLNNIDVSELKNDKLKGLFSSKNYMINPDISNWNIEYIPSNFFDSNNHIKEFTIPNGVTSIKTDAFLYCSGLSSVEIPDSVTSIVDHAFYGCSGLTSIDIPNSVTSIGGSAFSWCGSLTSVTIGNNVTSIGDYAFSGCYSLTSVHISDIAAWCAISFGNNGANPLFYAHNLYFNGELVTDLVIPNSVTSIGKGAFSDCSSLTSVTISKHCHISEDFFPKNCKIIRR